MPVTFDRREIKAEARALLQSGRVPPLRVTLLFIALNLILNLIGTGANYMLAGKTALTAQTLPFSFVSIFVSLFATVLLAGYTRYCLGVSRGEEMPYASLASAFPFAGRVILLSLLQALLIGLGFMLMIVPGVVLAFAYAFALFHLCEEPETGVVAALRRSREELRGFKGQLFLLLLSFFPLLVLLALPVAACQFFLDRMLPETLGGDLLYSFLSSLLTGCAALYMTPYIAFSQIGFYRRVTALWQDGVPDGGEPE